MSEIHFDEILSKFAGITSIIVETSKIKEFVCQNPNSDALQEAYDRIKVEVETLTAEAFLINEIFSKLDKHAIVVNGDLETIPKNENSPEESGKDESSDKNGSGKPLIKLVDIQKLVDPKSVIKPRLNPVAFAQKEPAPPNKATDDAVLVISSSDDETGRLSKMRQNISKKLAVKSSASTALKATQKSEKSMSALPTTSQRTRPISRRKAAVATAKKIERVFRESSSSSSSDDDSSRGRRSTFKSKKTNLENVHLSDTSVRSETSTISKQQKSTKKSSKNDEFSDSDGYYADIDWRNDDRLKLKCYVKLVKIPCDKLKDFYLEKMELVNINK